MIYKLVWVGAGGCIGAIARYVISGQVQQWTRSIDFPYGTLTVNVLGCLLIGALSYLTQFRSMFSPEIRLLLFMGVLGAFTTYSTFGNETVTLVNDGKGLLALMNIGLHLALGLGAVWAGQMLAHHIWR